MYHVPSTEDKQKWLDDLKTFLSYRTISTDPNFKNDMVGATGWLVDKFSKLGLVANIYESGNGNGHPIVVASSFKNTDFRTVLIYGHYDIQPPDPLSEWVFDPFDAHIADGRVYARGAADNKGQILAHILGMEHILKNGNHLPVNLIFLIEGEEEIGSPHLEDFIIKHRDQLRADLIIISDTAMTFGNHPTLTYALRGVAAMEIHIQGPSADLHSGLFGGAVGNPLAYLSTLLASMYDSEGRVRIPGFYDDIPSLENWEYEAMNCLNQSLNIEANLTELAGVSRLLHHQNYSCMELIGSQPTAEINGLFGGYQGHGTKTIIPKEATAKLTFRLVGHQNPDKILSLAQKYFESQKREEFLMTIKKGHSGYPFQSDPFSKDGIAIQASILEIFGKKPFLLRDGGSIPILAVFKKIFGVGIYLVGLANPDSKVHSPNENLLVENFFNGIELHKSLINHLSSFTKQE